MKGPKGLLLFGLALYNVMDEGIRRERERRTDERVKRYRTVCKSKSTKKCGRELPKK